MRQSRKKSLSNRRYYYRKKVESQFHVDVNARTIELPTKSIEDISPPHRYYVRQLLKMGYQCQLSLF